MEWIIWVIVIVLIIAIVWWLMSRDNRRGASTHSRPGETVLPADPAGSVPAGTPAGRGGAAPPVEAAATAGLPGAAGFAAAAEAPASPAAAEDAGRLEDPRLEAEGTGPATATTADEPDEDWGAKPSAQSTSEEAAGEAGPAASGRTGTSHPAAPVEAGDVDEWDTSSAPSEPSDADAETAMEPGVGVTADDVQAPDDGSFTKTGTASAAAAADSAEWEASWSEGAQTPDHHGSEHQGPATAGSGAAAAMPPGAEASSEARPTHHHEYTDLHAPTLPGAETAAAEDATEESAGGQTSTAGASSSGDLGQSESVALAGGHLASDQPYGEGSAAPGPDGSGPEGYTVKGNAAAMTYHDEDSPAYAEAAADVWFVSVAHAEAAGFRPPRRNRH